MPPVAVTPEGPLGEAAAAAATPPPSVWLSGDRAALAAVAAVTLLAKGTALLPGYSIDDYGTSEGPGGLLPDVLGKARYGHWVFLKIAMALQVEPNGARILWVSLAILAYSVFGLAVIRFFGLRGNGWLPLTAAAIVANHPYTAEIFTFRIGLPLAAIVVAILALLLRLAARPEWRPLTGSALFAAALSFYPIALHFGLMAALAGGAVTIAGWLVAAARDGDPAGRGDAWGWGRLRRDRNVHLLAYVLGGTALYSLFGKVFGSLAGIDESYFGFLPPEEAPSRIRAVGGNLLSTLAGDNVLVPPVVQALLGGVVACAAVGVIAAAARARSTTTSKLAAVLGVAVLLAAALPWSLGLFLVLEGFWITPRSMAHVGLFWAACVVIAVQTAPARWLRRGLAAAALAITLSFVAVNQQIFDDQRRLNQRDFLLANGIIARLERLPGFEHARRVVFVGTMAWYPAGLMPTQWGDMNVSGFGAFWSKSFVLREASGYDLTRSHDPAEEAAAAAYCASRDPWPGLESVELQGELAIVCLARSGT